MERSNIVLIGMPGSGKSTVGVLLAKALGYDFVDTDLLIQLREGCTLEELLRRKGIDAFLDIEGEVCAALEAENTVIATGGSAAPARAFRSSRMWTRTPVSRGEAVPPSRWKWAGPIPSPSVSAPRCRS